MLLAHRPSAAGRSPIASPSAVVPAGRATSLALTACAALFASSLAADDTVPVSLSFAGEFGGRPFDCATRFENIGASGASVAVTDFRLYVSRVRLLDAAGAETPLVLDEDGRWQGEGVALLDFEDATGNCANGTAPVNTTLVGQAPDGDYTGVAFDIGVPFDRNHGDPTLAGSPLNLTALFWNWRGGYRFMRVDLAGVSNGEAMDTRHGDMKQGDTKHGDMEAADEKHGDMARNQAGAHAAGMQGTEEHGGTMAHGKGGAMQGAGHGGGHGSGWAMHIGSTGCTAPTPTTAPDACSAPNRIEVVLTDFDPRADTIVIDPALALAGVDVSSNTPDTAPGCMSSPDDPECETVLDSLGLGADGTAQTFVTAR